MAGTALCATWGVLSVFAIRHFMGVSTVLRNQIPTTTSPTPPTSDHRSFFWQVKEFSDEMKIVVGRYNHRIHGWLHPKIASVRDKAPEILPKPGTTPDDDEELPQELKEYLGMVPPSASKVPVEVKPAEDSGKMKLPEPWKAGVCAVMAVTIVMAKRRFGGGGGGIHGVQVPGAQVAAEEAAAIKRAAAAAAKAP